MRQESDFIGVKTIPPAAYWGVHTARAVENFPITGHTVAQMPELIRAFAFVKKAAAHANLQLGVLNTMQAGAIAQACDDLIAGQLHDQFVVDVIQGGAGTSTNMNANEVIANRALEILGHERGEYKFLHPLEHVNLSQSTNDVYPTAVKVALRFLINDLIEGMEVLRLAFAAKAEEFKDLLKMGRTQLQDAVPMTLGQEFSTYAVMLEEDQQRLREGALLIQEMNLGATAIGTVALDAIVTGDRVQPGDALIGIPSSGIHSNGYTLARKALLEEGIDGDPALSLEDRPQELAGLSVADALLEPTAIYVKAIVELLGSEVDVRGLAHITGGGLTNLLRIGGERVGYRIDDPLPSQPVFALISDRANVSTAEMWEVFNMGCGFAVTVPEDDAATTVALLAAHHPGTRRIGTVTDRPGSVTVPRFSIELPAR